MIEDLESSIMDAVTKKSGEKLNDLKERAHLYELPYNLIQQMNELVREYKEKMFVVKLNKWRNKLNDSYQKLDRLAIENLITFLQNDSYNYGKNKNLLSPFLKEAREKLKEVINKIKIRVKFFFIFNIILIIFLFFNIFIF